MNRRSARVADPMPLFSEQSERNIIGKALVDSALFWDTYSRLQPEHFAFSRLARIWDAMCRLASTSKPVNRNFVPLAIRDDAKEETPIAMFLALLINDASEVDGEEIGIAVQTIYSLAMKRSLIDSLERAKAGILATDVGVAVELMQDHAMKAIVSAVGDDSDNFMKTYHQWGLELQRDAFESYERGEDGGIGLSPGLAAVETVMGRLLPGKTYVLAGMSSAGKSALARQICEASAKQAIEQKLGFVQVESLEMSGKESAARHISEQLGIPGSQIEQGSMNRAELEALANAVERMRKLPIIVDAQPRMSINDIRARALRTKQRRGLCLLAIDHILLMSATQRNMSPTERVSESTMEAKNLAKELNVPVILLSQVDEKKLLESPSGMPNSTHLFGGQAIQQNTDVTMFVHRPEVILAKKEPSSTAPARGKEELTPHQIWVQRMDKVRGVAYVYNNKRRGGTGNVKRELQFHGPTMTFSDPVL